MDSPHAPVALRYALPLFALAVGGVAAAWVLAAFALEAHCAWLALVAALDMLLLLRLARWPAGGRSALVAVAGTALSIALANYGIAAAEVGRNMGLLPWASALRLGPDYAAMLMGLANGAAEWGWYVLALVGSAWGGFSGLRPAPSAR